MRVLYDHQIFQEQNFGGVSRYFTELYSNASGFSAEIAVVRSDNQHLLSLPGMKGRIRPYQVEIDAWLWKLKFRGKGRVYDLLQKIARRPTLGKVNVQNSIARIRSSQHDLFHPTYYDPYFLDALESRPFVLTVHDLIHEFFPEDFLPEDSTRLRKQILCQRATRIIAVSNTTKKDLVEYLGIDPNKIDVVYHGNSINSRICPSTSSAGLPNRYILFIGHRRGYKNFPLFVRAVADILIENSSLKLVCTGPPFTKAERSVFEQLSIADRMVHRTASDCELGALYAGAEMFVFPSLYEGFGLPILEAFVCGCPVVLSDTPTMREVAGEAALFFHPRDAPELRSAVSRILDDDTLKKTLVDRGHQREMMFSWQKTALETAAVYRRTLKCASPS